MPKPNDVGVGSALLILNNEGKILLGKRKGAHRAGHWAAPGGWIDREDEKTQEAAIREALEETGITAKAATPLCWTTEDHPEIECRTITLYHLAFAGTWSGTPTVMEPDKCEEWVWISRTDLPSPLFPGIQQAVDVLNARMHLIVQMTAAQNVAT